MSPKPTPLGRRTLRSRLGHLAYLFFPVWTSRFRLWQLERLYRPDLEATRKSDRQKHDDLLTVYWHFRSEHEDHILGVETRSLLRRARRLDVDVGAITQAETNWNDDDFGNRYLNGESIDEITRRVRCAARESWKFRATIINQIGGVLIGLVGAIAGLVALLRH